MIVVDASMTIAWWIARDNPADQQCAQNCLDSLLFDRAIVPSLWHTEITNVLRTYERRQLLTADQTDAFLSSLQRLPIETDSIDVGQRRELVLSLARRHQLSTYDACYLDVALREQATLATLDRRLADAARSAGITVFGDSALHEPASVSPRK